LVFTSLFFDFVFTKNRGRFFSPYWLLGGGGGGGLHGLDNEYSCDMGSK
jgi:hypothetical protein